MVAHCRLVLANLLRLSVNFPTKRGRKNGKEKERKKKGGAPRAPTPPKGGEDSTRGRRGGARARTLSGWAKSPDVGSGQGASHAVPLDKSSMHY